MLIDWFTVIAQIINFLILIFLLKRFLYGPIIKAMEEREAHIAANLSEAEEKLTQAKEMAAAHQHQLDMVGIQCEEMLAKAQEEGRAYRKSLFEKARQEIEALRESWFHALQREKDQFRRDLHRLTSQKVFAIVRRALSELANADLEAHIVEVFIRRLRDLDATRRQSIAASLRSLEEPVIIQSAFEIPAESRTKLIQAVQEQVNKDVSVAFEVQPELIGGLALKGHYYETDWNLDAYWRELEASLSDALEKKLSAKERELVSRRNEHDG